MKKCIICDTPNDAKSIEHIVSESLGNKNYVIEKGKICDDCNNKFAKFEGKALSNSIILMERARLGTKTKAGKSVNGKIKGLNIKGHPDFIKQNVIVSGIDSENLSDFDPNRGTLKLRIDSFDKSEAATAKFLLKVGIEALFTSKKKIFKKYNFDELKLHLTNKNNKDWGFILASKEHGKFDTIPIQMDKVKLKKISCELRFHEKSNNELLFKFKYGAVAMIINLINRNLDWVKIYQLNEDHVNIYPSHLSKITTNK